MTSWIIGSTLSYLASKFLAGQTSLNINIKHAMPGRVRLQCDRWKDSNVTSVLAAHLRAHPLVSECTVSSITGSLLLILNKEYLSEKEFDHILKTATSASVEGFTLKEADTIRLMKKAVQSVNRAVKAKTLGTVDLKSVIVVTLVGKGVLAMRTNPAECGRNLLLAYRLLDGEGVKR